MPALAVGGMQYWCCHMISSCISFCILYFVFRIPYFAFRISYFIFCTLYFVFCISYFVFCRIFHILLCVLLFFVFVFVIGFLDSWWHAILMLLHDILFYHTICAPMQFLVHFQLPLYFSFLLHRMRITYYIYVAIYGRDL